MNVAARHIAVKNWILLIASLSFGACAAPDGSPLDAAFQSMRKGDFGPVSALAPAEPGLMDELVPFFDDPDESVRREALNLAASARSGAGCPLIVKALDDPSADIRERAARTLYARCEAARLEPAADVAAALRRSVAAGNTAAASVLLLGRVPVQDNAALLAALAEDSAPVKWQPWDQAIPRSVAALVALLQYDLETGRQGLEQIVAAGGLSEQVFLLQVLGQIDDPTLLASLAKHLSDQREIGGGVPSGAKPQRRLCDLAADAFGAKYALAPPPDAPRAPRYDDAALARIAAEVAQRLK